MEQYSDESIPPIPFNPLLVGLDLAKKVDFDLYQASQGDLYLLNLERGRLALQSQYNAAHITNAQYEVSKAEIDDEIIRRQETLLKQRLGQTAIDQTPEEGV